MSKVGDLRGDLKLMQCAVLSISYCKEMQERRAGIQAKDSYLYGNKVNLL